MTSSEPTDSASFDLISMIRHSGTLEEARIVAANRVLKLTRADTVVFYEPKNGSKVKAVATAGAPIGSDVTEEELAALASAELARFAKMQEQAELEDEPSCTTSTGDGPPLLCFARVVTNGDRAFGAIVIARQWTAPFSPDEQRTFSNIAHVIGTGFARRRDLRSPAATPGAATPRANAPRQADKPMTAHEVAERARGIVVGDGRAHHALLAAIERCAPSDLAVLIHGETGTGKECVAKLVHACSGRRGPFVVVNVAAIPSTLFDAQLFGALAGSFTGATRDLPGLIRQAGGGTLFLDELGELPLEMQPKLLRAIQEKEVLPVGGTKPIKVDFRLVSATNRNLKQCVKEGTFREDLFYRVNVVPIHLLPLRERREEIPRLAEHFVRSSTRPRLELEAAAIPALLQYPWMGNIRQLENVVQLAILHAQGNRITATDLARAIAMHEAATATPPRAAPPAGDRLTKERLREALKATGGNKTQAAKMLGVSPRSVFRWLEENPSS